MQPQLEFKLELELVDLELVQANLDLIFRCGHRAGDESSGRRLDYFEIFFISAPYDGSRLVALQRGGSVVPKVLAAPVQPQLEFKLELELVDLELVQANLDLIFRHRAGESSTSSGRRIECLEILYMRTF
jgi:hypothetical protein